MAYRSYESTSADNLELTNETLKIGSNATIKVQETNGEALSRTVTIADTTGSDLDVSNLDVLDIDATVHFDFERFIRELRNRLGSVSSEAEQGIGWLVQGAREYAMPSDRFACVLATAWWETARTMQPVREAFFMSSDCVKEEAWRERNLSYYPYYGRGYALLTHKANYRKASQWLGPDFVSNPDLALEPKNAQAILFQGMNEGWFSSRTLGTYIDDLDDLDDDLESYRRARSIINGANRKDEIAALALVFEKALFQSGFDPNHKNKRNSNGSSAQKTLPHSIAKFLG